MVPILDPPSLPNSPGSGGRGRREAKELAATLVDQILGSDVDDSSIHAVVASRLPERAGPRALAPGPEVDAALHRLVALLVSRFDARPGDNSPDHWDVLRSTCHLIESDPERSDRALSVRRAAGHAESLMEIHHASHLLANTASDLPAESTPKQSLRYLLRGFPYLSNYERLVEAELAGFKRLGSANRLAFCGAGALPLTAINWHIATKSAITLVEIDPYVADLASQVIQRLTHHDVLEEEALTVVAADAAELDARPFNMIAVASLVPNDSVEDLARTVAKLGDKGPILMARSALGLTRLLAYSAIDIEAIESAGLRHIGTIAPRHQVSNEPNLAQIAVQQNDRLLHRASNGVLNTSEFFATTDRLA